MRTTKYSCMLFLLVLALHLTISAQPSKSDEEFLRRAFHDYKEAILQRRGQAATLLVSRATLQYYLRMRELALEAPEKEVRALSPLNKLMVLSLRHRIAVDTLRGMTAEQVFTHAVDQGWIGKNSVLDMDIGRMQVFGNDAAAEIVKSGKPTPLKFRFSKEDGGWRIDLTSLMPLSDQAMAMAIKRVGQDEDAFLIQLLESVSGRKVSPSIWQPPGK